MVNDFKAVLSVDACGDAKSRADVLKQEFVNSVTVLSFARQIYPVVSWLLNCDEFVLYFF